MMKRYKNNMYEIKLLDGEEIILISDDSILKVAEEDKNITTILTDKRLLLLDYPSPINNYQEAMKYSRATDYIKQKEIILAVWLDRIVSITKEEKYDKYLLDDTNYFYLIDKNLKKELLRLNDK